MKKTISAVLAVLMILVLLTAACGSNGIDGTSDREVYSGYNSLTPEKTSSFKNAQAERSDSPSPTSAVKTGEKTDITSNQKLIKTLRVEIETLDFDQSVIRLRALVESSGGYIENSTVYGQSYQNSKRRTATFTVRIPVQQLEKTEEELSTLGNIISSTANVTDITLTYADTAARVSALEAQRDSLLSMLQKAENLQDLLTIQDHLTDVEYQLESYASKLRLMDNQVEYSSISLTLEEVKILTEPEDESFGARLGKLFKDSLKSVGNFFEDLVLFLLGRLPILLVWGVVIAAIILIIRLLVRKNRKSRRNKPVVPLENPPVRKE